MCTIYKNINNYNPDKENKILIVFDDIIADMINNKKTKFNINKVIYQRQKIKHLFCFYYTVIL